MLSTPKKLLGYFRRYWITPSTIWVRQQRGWVELRRKDIAAVKFETVSKVIVRLYGGQRQVISFYGFSMAALNAVAIALRDTLRQNEKARGLWQGTKIFGWYEPNRTP